jgi:hypothetical protein
MKTKYSHFLILLITEHSTSALHNISYYMYKYIMYME